MSKMQVEGEEERVLLSRYPRESDRTLVVSRHSAAHAPSQTGTASEEQGLAFQIRISFTLSDATQHGADSIMLDKIRKIFSRQKDMHQCLVATEDGFHSNFVSVVCACVFVRPNSCQKLRKALQRACFGKPKKNKIPQLEPTHSQCVHVTPMADNSLALAIFRGISTRSRLLHVFPRYTVTSSWHHPA